MEASAGQGAPRILSRPEHVISRKNIDPDALRVLYRLKKSGFVAYLVGGGVRDLLLERQPKDFDIGTSAHPQQVRRLFGNCFIVGRRFRLAHVRFGRKLIEVSTFRRAAEPEAGETLIRRDNTFGTPEEDAFRRDFTVNALFYDIANFSVIDWVGGLEDLKARVIRTIGDPAVRFREDPVRMLRAIALAARLDFTIDRDTAEAVRSLRGEIVRSSPARILEELYKILRQGRSRETIQMLHEYGLLAYLLPTADRAIGEGGEALLGSLSRLDSYRRSGASVDQLTNPVLLGSLLVPLGVPLRRDVVTSSAAGRTDEGAPDRPRAAIAEEAKLEDDDSDLELETAGAGGVLALPFARRDLDRLRIILHAQRRLREAQGSAGRRMLASRNYFDEAVRWLEIHGGPEGALLAAQWHAVEKVPVEPHVPAGSRSHGGAEAASADGQRDPRRRRRRRRGPGPKPGAPA